MEAVAHDLGQGWRSRDCTADCVQERVVARHSAGTSFRYHHDLDAHTASLAEREDVLSWAISVLIATAPGPMLPGVLRLGPLVIDLVTESVLKNGRPLRLMPLERACLLALAAAEGRPLSYEELAEAFWAGHWPRSYKVCVRHVVERLRYRLGAARYLVGTVRRAGYVLSELG